MISNLIKSKSEYNLYYTCLKSTIFNKSTNFPKIFHFFSKNPEFLDKIIMFLEKPQKIEHLDKNFEFFSRIIKETISSQALWIDSLQTLEFFSEALVLQHFFLIFLLNFEQEFKVSPLKYLIFLHNSYIYVGLLDFKNEEGKKATIIENKVSGPASNRISERKIIEKTSYLGNNEIFWDILSTVLSFIENGCEDLGNDEMFLWEEARKYKKLLTINEKLEEITEKPKKKTKTIEKFVIRFLLMLLRNDNILLDYFKEKIDLKAKSLQILACKIISSFILILQGINDVFFEKNQQFLLKLLEILYIFSQKPEILNKFIIADSYRKTAIMLKILDFIDFKCSKTIINSDISIKTQEFLESSIKDENLINNVIKIIEVFKVGLSKNSLKESIKAKFNDFLINLLDNEKSLFIQLFDENDISFLNSLKNILIFLDKSRLLDQVLKMILHTNSIPLHCRKQLKNLFLLIKDMQIKENSVYLFKTLIKHISEKPSYSQEILHFGEILHIFHDLLILHISEKNYFELINEFSLFLNCFLLKNQITIVIKHELVTDTLKKIFQKQRFFIKLLEIDDFLQTFFKSAISKENSHIFFVFLDFFFNHILLEPDLDPVYRNQFFHQMDEFLIKLMNEEETEEFQEKMLIFFCVFLETVIFQKHRFNHFEEIFENPENAISLDVLFYEKKSSDYSIYFLATRHFETFLDVALNNPNFQTKETVTNIFKLAYTILSSDMEIQIYFKNKDLDHKLYQLLSSVFYSKPFELCELMFLLNLLLNMATSGEFYFLVEKHLLCKEFLIYSTLSSPKKSIISNNSSHSRTLNQTLLENREKINKSKNSPANINILSKDLENSENFSTLFPNIIRENNKETLISAGLQRKKAQFIEKSPKKQEVEKTLATHYDRDLEISHIVYKYSTDLADISKYIRIRIPCFLDLIIRFLYEIPGLDGHLKMFYIIVLKNLISDNCCYNAAFLAQDFIILRLLLCLRLENEENIREEINKTLSLILTNFMNNHQLKAIFNLMLYNMSLDDYGLNPLYKKRNHINNFMLTKQKTTEKDVLKSSVLFTTELEYYKKSLISSENYSNLLQSLLRLLHTLIKDSPKQEKSNKILNFSGQNSGIVITNLQFPIKSFTITLEIMFDNLMTSDKLELQQFYRNYINKNNQTDNKTVPPPQDHLISYLWPENKISDKDYFSQNLSPTILKALRKHENIKKSTVIETKNLPKTQNKTPESKKPSPENKPSSLNSKYSPRIFSLQSNDDNTCNLDIYLNEQRYLNIELFYEKTHIVDTFSYEFKERQKYDLIISYSNEQFQVFIEDKELSIYKEIPSNRVPFPKLLYEKFQYLKYFTIGCSPSKNDVKSHEIKALSPLMIENSLSGTIYSFRLIDKATHNPNEINQILNNQKSLSINLFEFLWKHNFSSENNWVSLGKSDPCTFENQQIFNEDKGKNSNLLRWFGFLNKNPGNSQKNAQKFDVKCKGVCYLQKTGFLDFFLMFGNVEVFFYLIDTLATENDLFDHERSHEILQEIFEIIKEMSYKKEVENSLRNGGFRVIAYLLNMYIQKRGCSHDLFKSILAFSQNFSSPELKFLCFSSLILNFELYFTCEATLQKRIISEILIFLQQESLQKPEKTLFFDKKSTIFYLFYCLSNYYPIDPLENEEILKKNAKNIDIVSCNSLENHNSRKNTGEFEDNIKELIVIRGSIIEIIEVLMRKTEAKSIFKENFDVLIENIAGKQAKGSTIKEFLFLLKRLLLNEGKPVELIKKVPSKLKKNGTYELINDKTSMSFGRIPVLKEKRSTFSNFNDKIILFNDFTFPNNSKENLLIIPKEKLKKKGSQSPKHLKKSEEFKENSKKSLHSNEIPQKPSISIEKFDLPLEKSNITIIKPSLSKIGSEFNSNMNINVDNVEKIEKGIKNIDICKILCNILASLELFKENYENYDDFLSLILHLLFHFIIEDSFQDKEKIIENNDKSSINQEKSLILEKNGEKHNSSDKSQKNRFSRPRIKINSKKLLKSLDHLLPDCLYEKSLTKLIDFLKYSVIYSLDFETILLPILWKRALKFEKKSLFLKFIRNFLTVQKKNEDVWFCKIREIPNFLSFMAFFLYELLKGNDTEALILFESFLNQLIFSMFYEENGMKSIKFFILCSKTQVSRSLEIVLNLAKIILDKFVNEHKDSLIQWKTQETYNFEPKINKMLKNLIDLTNLLEELSLSSLLEQSLLPLYQDVLERYFDLLNNLNLLYCTIPEHINQNADIDFENKWEKLTKETENQEIPMREGGIFRGLLCSFFNIMCRSLVHPELHFLRIQSLNHIGQLIFPIKKQKKPFEISNHLFRKLCPELFEKPDLEKSKGNFNLSQNTFYELALYKLLEVLLIPLQDDFGAIEEKFLIEMIILLKEILEISGIDFHSKVLNNFFGSPNKKFFIPLSNSLHIHMREKKNEENNEEELLKDEFMLFGRLFNQEFRLINKKTRHFQENLEESIHSQHLMNEELEMMQKYSKSVEETPTIKLEFLSSLKEILNKGYSDMTRTIKELMREVIRNKEEITNVIKPVLYLNSYRMEKFVEIYGGHRLKLYLDKYQAEIPEIPNNFIIGNDDAWEWMDVVNVCERDSKKIDEKLIKQMETFAEKEEVLIMKASKRWDYQKSQMMTSKGFWHMTSSKKTQILKLDKQQDRYFRRFFIKPLKIAQDTYLSHTKKIALLDINRKTQEITKKSNVVKSNEEFLVSVDEEKESFLLVQDNTLEKNGKNLENIGKNVKNHSMFEKFKFLSVDQSPDDHETFENKKNFECSTSKKREYLENEQGIIENFQKTKIIQAENSQNIAIENNSKNENSSNNHKNSSKNEVFIEDLSKNENLMEKSSKDDKKICISIRSPLNIEISQKSPNSFGNQELNEIVKNPLHLKLAQKSSETSIFSIENHDSIIEKQRIQTDPIIENNNQIIRKSHPKMKSGGNLITLKVQKPTIFHKNSKKKNGGNKNRLNPYKKAKNLKYSYMDLQKFSKQDIEDLENDMRDSKRLTYQKENNHFAEKITLKGAYYGLIEMTREYFIFRAQGHERPEKFTGKYQDFEPEEGDPIYEFFGLGTKKINFLSNPLKKQWNLREIVGVQGRSFNLRHSAFEIFTNENKAYFFNVYDPKIAEQIIKKFQKLKKNNSDFFYNRAEAFKSSGIQEKWIKGQISNFEYLSLINTYAGRTYNDIHQYPVFPWILKDYTSAELDLSNPNVYRDLSQPIGAMDHNRLKIFLDNYKTLSKICDDNIYTQPFLYGTHYSGIGPVLHYLMRLEPFANLHIQLQSGSFDCPDRLFSSIPQAWKSCLERDFKELTPEFFYLPDFLLNRNKFEFGKGQNGDVIGCVELPKWAKSAYEFVFMHKNALESEWVSKKLQNWIDLIFGYKQRGKNAVDANNVFGYLTYEGNVDLLKISDMNERRGIFEQISEYGQTPYQLFTNEHPSKVVLRFDKTELLKKTIEIVEPHDRCDGICDSNISLLKLRFSNNFHDIAVFLNNNSVLFYPVDDIVPIKKKMILHEERRIYQINGKFSQNEYSPASQIYIFTKKKRVYLFGGSYDGSLKAFAGSTELKILSDFTHKKPITCISACEECQIIACGSKDCRISLWKYDKMGLNLYNELLYGHNNEIITLKINEILDLLVSADKDGILLLHEIRKGRFIRRIIVDLEREEFVNNLDIHENGLILIGTNDSRIFVYSLNGDLINTVKLNNELKLSYKVMEIKFVSKWNSYFAVSDSEGEILIYDSFHPELINSWNMKNFNEKSALRSFDIHDGEKTIAFICGCEKGTLLLMNLIDKDKLTKHTLETYDKNLIFLKQLIDHE